MEFIIDAIDGESYGVGVDVSTDVYEREAGGTTYWLRLIGGTWVFRPITTRDTKALYYLTNASTDAIEQSTFEAAMMAGEFGRFLIHKASDWSTCHLWLAPDGNGRALIDQDLYDFKWEYEQGRYDIRAMTGSQCAVFAAHVFKTYVNPFIEDPFIIDRSVDFAAAEPEFICGSEDELKKVATWILQAEPRLFAEVQEWSPNEVSLDFNSLSPDGQPYLNLAQQQFVPRTGPDVEDFGDFDKIIRLAEIAFEHNAFTGRYWEYQDFNGHRRSGWGEMPQSVGVRVETPTAAETMEARRNLREWMAGKVPGVAIDALLDLSPIVIV